MDQNKCSLGSGVFLVQSVNLKRFNCNENISYCYTVCNVYVIIIHVVLCIIHVVFCLVQVGVPSNSVSKLGLHTGLFVLQMGYVRITRFTLAYKFHDYCIYILSLLLDKRQNLCVCVAADHAVAHGFMQQVFCRAQATRPPSSPSLPSPCSLAHRHQVLATCVSDLVRVGNLDDQLSDRANCAATFLQCQLLGEEVGVSLTYHVVVM